MSQGEKDRYYVLCEDLFKLYKIADLEVVALRGLDLRVESGELLAIVGASGSGKTTLLNIFAGLDTPSAGRVTVGGRDLLKMSGSDLVAYRRREVGFVWQQVGRNLVPYLTALQNVELPLILLNHPREQRTKRARRLLELVGLGDRLHYTPERLSGGQQQRVSIGVALANNPPLLLADEPTGELDNQTAQEVFDVLRSVNREYGTTIIIVTHDPNIARHVDRVVAIRDGKTSTETLRRLTYKKPGEEQERHEEYIIVDSSGRLQIPREYMDRLDIKERAKIYLEQDHLSVWPEVK